MEQLTGGTFKRWALENGLVLPSGNGFLTKGWDWPLPFHPRCILHVRMEQEVPPHMPPCWVCTSHPPELWGNNGSVVYGSLREVILLELHKTKMKTSGDWAPVNFPIDCGILVDESLSKIHWEPQILMKGLRVRLQLQFDVKVFEILGLKNTRGKRR
jgi:hypothetical protein